MVNSTLCKCDNCGTDFHIETRFLKRDSKSRKVKNRFCSIKCKSDFKTNKNTTCVECKVCGEIFKRRNSQILKIKSGNYFCSSSCSAKYNNTHKKTGTRRSKLEVWIEEQLKNKYSFEIVFNGKEAIKSELDIYIPSLNLAFELNGIFHYEPIYGEDKFDKIKNNDNRKFQACLERKIELCIIDVSSSKHFKPERDKKYLEIIEDVINKKMK
jgi:hypothetical protein